MANIVVLGRPQGDRVGELGVRGADRDLGRRLEREATDHVGGVVVDGAGPTVRVGGCGVQVG